MPSGDPVSALLSSLPTNVTDFGNRVADFIEEQSNTLASQIRNVAESASWIPESVRPPVREVSHVHGAQVPAQGIVGKFGSWISRNRTAVAVVLAFTGTTAALVYRQRKNYTRRRRARRGRNGKKVEIVVLACSSFHHPYTRSLALDLDRRGYIVYITVSSEEDDRLVRSEGKLDIKPLRMDFSQPKLSPVYDIHPDLEPLDQLIRPSSVLNPPGSDKQARQVLSQFTLVGVVLLSGCSGLMPPSHSSISMDVMIQNVNTHLVSPLLAAQQFIPLLLKAASYTNNNNVTDQHPQQAYHRRSAHPSVILANTPIPSSTHVSDRTLELMISSSLSSLARFVSYKFASVSSVTVTELRLGLFDTSSAITAKCEQSRARSVATAREPSSTSSWHTSERNTRPPHRSSTLPREAPKGNGHGSSSSGSSMRLFHNAVFDALNQPPRVSSRLMSMKSLTAWFNQCFRGIESPRNERFMPVAASASLRAARKVVYVGQWARTYDLLGGWLPDGIVGWMLRRRQQHQQQRPIQSQEELLQSTIGPLVCHGGSRDDNENSQDPSGSFDSQQNNESNDGNSTDSPFDEDDYNHRRPTDGHSDMKNFTSNAAARDNTQSMSATVVGSGEESELWEKI